MLKPGRGLMSYCFCTGTALYKSLNKLINSLHHHHRKVWRNVSRIYMLILRFKELSGHSLLSASIMTMAPVIKVPVRFLPLIFQYLY